MHTTGGCQLRPQIFSFLASEINFAVSTVLYRTNMLRHTFTLHP